MILEAFGSFWAVALHGLSGPSLTSSLQRDVHIPALRLRDPSEFAGPQSAASSRTQLPGCGVDEPVAVRYGQHGLAFRCAERSRLANCGLDRRREDDLPSTGRRQWHTLLETESVVRVVGGLDLTQSFRIGPVVVVLPVRRRGVGHVDVGAVAERS